MDLHVNLGDLIWAATFIFYAGANWMLLRQHGTEIKSLRRWKHDEVTPDVLDLKLRVGLLEELKPGGSR